MLEYQTDLSILSNPKKCKLFKTPAHQHWLNIVFLELSQLCLTGSFMMSSITLSQKFYFKLKPLQMRPIVHSRFWLLPIKEKNIFYEHLNAIHAHSNKHMQESRQCAKRSQLTHYSNKMEWVTNRFRSNDFSH